MDRPDRAFAWGCAIAGVLWLVIALGVWWAGHRGPLAEAVAWHELPGDRW